MQRLHTAFLLHETPHGRHVDWLIEPPGPDASTGPLWTARVPYPPKDWHRNGAWLLDELPPHRRRYLRYQGPISEGRGRVVRVAQGLVLPELWAEPRRVLSLRLACFTGRVTLERLSAARWRASVT